MTLRKMFLSAMAAAGLALSLGGAASAGTVTIEPSFLASALNQPGPQRFYITAGTPYTPSISALFEDTISGADTAFTDTYDFIIPQDGLGSGSLTASISGKGNAADISTVLIDGVSYTPTVETTDGVVSGYSLTVSGIPITAYDTNSIEVEGMTGSSASGFSYDGTATFTAVSAAPEPAAWLLMIGGIGFAGVALRRRRTDVQFA